MVQTKEALPVQPIPPTIERLRSLKPGESMTYYVGNFSADIAASEDPKWGFARRGGTTYANILRSIRDEAYKLAREGKIRLSEVQRVKKIRNIEHRDTEYIAQRLPK